MNFNLATFGATTKNIDIWSDRLQILSDFGVRFWTDCQNDAKRMKVFIKSLNIKQSILSENFIGQYQGILIFKFKGVTPDFHLSPILQIIEF